MKKADLPEAVVAREVPVFPKEQILKAKQFAHRKDALGFLLDNGKEYTLVEVKAILNNYMKGKVK